MGVAVLIPAKRGDKRTLQLAEMDERNRVAGEPLEDREFVTVKRIGKEALATLRRRGLIK